MLKLGRMHRQTGDSEMFVDRTAMSRQMREVSDFRLEFVTFKNLVLTHTIGSQKPSRRWTRHIPDGNHHNQIDYILLRKRFRSGINIHRTRSFPGADIGSDQDLVMITFRVRSQTSQH